MIRNPKKSDRIGFGLVSDRIWIGFGSDLYISSSKRLKHDLLKLSQIIEASTESLICHDYNDIEPTEIRQTLERAHLNWVKYLQAYEEYSRVINDSSELERLSIQRRTLERNLNDCNQLAIDQLDKSIRSLQRGSIPVDNHHFNDDERISLSAHSSISMSRSSKSRRSVGSSVSSKARAQPAQPN